MNTLSYVLMTVVVTVGAVSAGYVIYKARKSGKTRIPWDKLQPIFFATIKEVMALENASDSYKTLEDYAVVLVNQQVQKATFLSDVEKDILTDDVIRRIIAPTLKQIYKGN